MFKRVLVLVLFLFGVFWWLTNRNNDEPAEPKNETVAEETAQAEGEGDIDEEEEENDEDADEETAEVEVKEEATAPVVTTTTATQPVVATNSASTTPAPVAPAPVVVRPSVPDRVTDVKVYMYEWNVDLSSKTIPAGTVNFTVQNDGRFTHDFNISEFGNLGKVMPNETKTFTLKLRAGEYEAFSKRRQDYERGVNETFTVTP